MLRTARSTSDSCKVTKRINYWNGIFGQTFNSPSLLVSLGSKESFASSDLKDRLRTVLDNDKERLQETNTETPEEEQPQAKEKLKEENGEIEKDKGEEEKDSAEKKSDGNTAENDQAKSRI